MDLGITEDGYEITYTPHAEQINQSDAYGATLIDLVFRGVDVSIMLNSLEYKTGPKSAIWPWGTLGTMGVIGRLGSAISLSLVLTATASTPAAAEPATLTAARSILAPENNVNLLFTSKLRRVPIRFVCLPSDSAVHFTST